MKHVRGFGIEAFIRVFVYLFSRDSVSVLDVKVRMRCLGRDIFVLTFDLYSLDFDNVLVLPFLEKLMLVRHRS